MYPPWNRFSPQSYSTNFSFSSFLGGCHLVSFSPKNRPEAPSFPRPPGLGALQPGLLLGSVEEIVVLWGALLTLVEILGWWHGDRVQGGGCECGFGCWLWLCLQEGRNPRCFVDMWFESASNTMRYDYKSCKLQGSRSRGELFWRFDFQRDLLYVTNAADQWIPRQCKIHVQ